jgi:hypothetical protein
LFVSGFVILMMFRNSMDAVGHDDKHNQDCRE